MLLRVSPLRTVTCSISHGSRSRPRVGRAGSATSASLLTPSCGSMRPVVAASRRARLAGACGGSASERSAVGRSGIGADPIRVGSSQDAALGASSFTGVPAASSVAIASTAPGTCAALASDGDAGLVAAWSAAARSVAAPSRPLAGTAMATRTGLCVMSAGLASAGDVPARGSSGTMATRVAIEPAPTPTANAIGSAHSRTRLCQVAVTIAPRSLSTDLKPEPACFGGLSASRLRQAICRECFLARIMSTNS